MSVQDHDYDAFLSTYPEYAAAQHIDELRAQEFARVDDQGHIYLDYTGGSLYPERLLREHMALLSQAVLGNPHSQNPTSLAATSLVEQARADVLAFFNADPEEYDVVFTANASAALKLLGESYPFGPRAHFLLVADNHNSVHGIREFARSKGASVAYIPLDPDSLRAPDPRPYLEQGASAQPKLFAFPAQSNFSGVQHPLAWVELAREYGYDVLLDAAAFAPTNRLDLGLVHPDFIPISFYKMFGYPTGVGVLLARREALERLQRPWFAGGTVQLVSTKADLYILSHGHEAFEEGTVNYLSLPAISNGLRFLQETGVEHIHARVAALVDYLLTMMQNLRHSNGEPLIQLYGPRDAERRGGVIAFNIVDPNGRLVPYQQVEAEANEARISIRSGCFCNPGAGEYSLTHTADEIRACVEGASREGAFDIDAFRACLGEKATGAVRASLGLVSNFSDARAFLDFLITFADRKAEDFPSSGGCN
ncbi:MAG: aminotransferase class V-fold PLP-dependent enzyme [Chloroflexi bacterium]|nr:aminotransferase class V-fold PLP-dependent enzyme [Chloroflexota bacterium]